MSISINLIPDAILKENVKISPDEKITPLIECRDTQYHAINLKHNYLINFKKWLKKIQSFFLFCRIEYC